MILKGEMDKKITNLTTAASIWFSAPIGMAIGFNYYIIAIATVAFAVLVPRIPHISKIKKNLEDDQGIFPLFLLLLNLLYSAINNCMDSFQLAFVTSKRIDNKQ